MRVLCRRAHGYRNRTNEHTEVQEIQSKPQLSGWQQLRSIFSTALLNRVYTLLVFSERRRSSDIIFDRRNGLVLEIHKHINGNKIYAL